MTAHEVGKWGRVQTPKRHVATSPKAWCFLCGAEHSWDECPLTIAERKAVGQRRRKGQP